MRKLASLLVLAMFTLPAFCAEQTFNDAPVVDVLCSKKVMANPDSHTKDCAMGCQASGFGIVTQDKKFLKFDAAGNKQIFDQIKSTRKEDHLRVNVSGDVQGDTLVVKSVKLL